MAGGADGGLGRGKVCNVMLADVDAVLSCVRAAIADADMRRNRGGSEGMLMVVEARDPEAGLPSEMSGAALLLRLEAALRESAVPDHCD